MSTFKIKPLHAADSYKLPHYQMYPKGTDFVYSNFTPRSTRLFKAPTEFFEQQIVVAGIQGMVKQLHYSWQEEFFDKPWEDVEADFIHRATPCSSDLRVDTAHIKELHDLGYLPIRIKGLPEGSRIGPRIAMMTVVNTDKKFYWVTNYLETYFSNELWKTTTSATIASVYRNILKKFALETGSSQSFVNWQGHDFSCRGMGGMIDAAKTGFGHLLSFTGSDTMVAGDYADWAYSGRDGFVLGSVDASEHSVMTFEGEDNEFEVFERLITEVSPVGVVSLVSDGYDYWRVITEYLPRLKDKILARAPNALGLSKVVIRPDSGDPVKIITGYLPTEYSVIRNHQNEPEYRCRETGIPLQLHEIKGSIECMWEIFGGTTTATGYRLLDSHIGLIYGDSITIDRAVSILQRLKDKKFASGNVVLGIGSFTYQYITRDTLGIAMKATWGSVNGVNRDIWKSPKTDSGVKKSAKGLIRIEHEDGVFVQYDGQDFEQEASGALIVYYNDGKFFNHQTITEIRLRLDPDFFIVD